VRRAIYRPKLRLEFRDDPECRSLTPAIVPSRSESGQTVQSLQEAYYVRIKVTNTKAEVAKYCRAYLVAVEKAEEEDKFEPTTYCDSLPLPWACRADAYAPADLPQDVPHFVDVLSANSLSPEFEPKVQLVPLRYVSLFREHGTFRFTVMVSGENVKPVSIRIVFRWDGHWDTFQVSLGKNG
jgi:hypothetical protein